MLTKSDETDRVVIQDSLTDEKINTVAAWWYGDYDLLQALTVPDADGNPTGKVALLLHEPATGKTLVRITDAATDAIQATLRGYNPDFDPMKLAVLADMNGNGAEEYAVLARNPDTGQVHAKIRDGVSNEAINTVWFDKDVHAARHGQHRRHQRQRRRGAGAAGALWRRRRRSTPSSRTPGPVRG